MATIGTKRKEIYKYEAPWTLYSMNWSVRPDKRFRLAVGSFVEEYNNKVQIVALNEETSEFAAVSTFDHPYPTTKIMWIPDSKGLFPDLVATSGTTSESGGSTKPRRDSSASLTM
ncbi:WD repeat-containing protein 68 [Apostichopus japonicus]|uniref:WD repeat-containing protein 68 n=1 Tax=Stichopus japonicus TaxID=307972 RepID=A0A2G8JUL8_STIJA|nr:WD repeat-containing protein 68 [Apostichopus japonicus]